MCFICFETGGSGGVDFKVFLNDTTPHLDEFRKKSTENYEGPFWQARPGIEPEASLQPVS